MLQVSWIGPAVALDADVGDAAADALGDGLRGGRIRAVQDHDELLAPIAADDIRLAQLRLDRRDDAREARIAGGVAVGVVDLLEVVEVEEQHRDRQLARLGAQAGGIEPLDQRAAVEDPRERVGLRAPLGIGEGEGLLAHVIGHPERDQHRGGDHRGREPVVDDALGTVGAGVEQAHRGRDLEDAQQAPGDQEPAGGAVAAAPPGEEGDHQREDRGADEHQVPDARDQRPRSRTPAARSTP